MNKSKSAAAAGPQINGAAAKKALAVMADAARKLATGCDMLSAAL